jgi:hypothetical protein
LQIAASNFKIRAPASFSFRFFSFGPLSMRFWRTRAGKDKFPRQIFSKCADGKKSEQGRNKKINSLMTFECGCKSAPPAAPGRVQWSSLLKLLNHLRVRYKS